MNKTQLIAEIKQTVDLTKLEIDKVLNAIENVITKTLKDSDNVTLVGFGTFSVANRAARVGRNPKTGEEIKIAATTVPKFKAGKNLRDEVSGKELATKPVITKAPANTSVKAPAKAPATTKLEKSKEVAKKK